MKRIYLIANLIIATLGITVKSFAQAPTLSPGDNVMYATTPSKFRRARAKSARDFTDGVVVEHHNDNKVLIKDSNTGELIQVTRNQGNIIAFEENLCVLGGYLCVGDRVYLEGESRMLAYAPLGAFSLFEHGSQDVRYYPKGTVFRYGTVAGINYQGEPEGRNKKLIRNGHFTVSIDWEAKEAPKNFDPDNPSSPKGLEAERSQHGIFQIMKASGCYGDYCVGENLYHKSGELAGVITSVAPISWVPERHYSKVFRVLSFNSTPEFLESYFDKKYQKNKKREDHIILSTGSHLSNFYVKTGEETN